MNCGQIHLTNNKTGQAYISKDTTNEFPEETNLARINDNLFIGGGPDCHFTVLEFELYGLIFE